jgi:hypothetical protein
MGSDLLIGAEIYTSSVECVGVSVLTSVLDNQLLIRTEYDSH